MVIIIMFYGMYRTMYKTKKEKRFVKIFMYLQPKFE